MQPRQLQEEASRAPGIAGGFYFGTQRILGYIRSPMFAFPKQTLTASPEGAEHTRSLLFVVTGLGWGGAETQVIELAIAFRARGWKVAVATLLKVAERREALEQRGIPVFTLGMLRGIPDPRAILRLRALIRDFAPAVLHAHMVHANLLARVTRLVATTPVLITTAHNINEGAYWRMLAYRLTDGLTDLTTNVSHAAVTRSVQRGAVPPARVRFVPNGVDFTQFHPDGAGRAAMRSALGLGEHFSWLAIGRLEEQKDYPNLLRAYQRVVRTVAATRLLIVGDGPHKTALQRLISELGLGREVVLLGKRNDVPDLMNAADAFVLSSAWEGLPMVLLEAAACRLPIVATDVGGCAQVVGSRSGLLVPARNAAALADAMTCVMRMSPEERSTLGANAANGVLNQFSMPNVVDLWESIYAQLLENKAAQARA